MRKYGVRVVTIQPDMTKTDLYRNADFAQGEEEASDLLPEEIAEAVRNILQMRKVRGCDRDHASSTASPDPEKMICH